MIRFSFLHLKTRLGSLDFSSSVLQAARDVFMHLTKSHIPNMVLYLEQV